MENNLPVVCFGEVLWDVFGEERKPGGAPMNVAYHVHTLGIPAVMISSVGRDEPGDSLLKFLNSRSFNTSFIQHSQEFPTGKAIARRASDQEIRYELAMPVAWDDIKPMPELDQLVQQASALVFGSLALRAEVSRSTLLELLELARYKVFDVNLRPPYYSPELILQLFALADLVKMNEEELAMICSWLSEQVPACDSDAIRVLNDAFPGKEFIVSRGARGAAYYCAGSELHVPARSVEVADTIGSGDSFLAAFITQRLRNQPIPQCLSCAADMGAFITSRRGACPVYTRADFEAFRTAQSSR